MRRLLVYYYLLKLYYIAFILILIQLDCNSTNLVGQDYTCFLEWIQNASFQSINSTINAQVASNQRQLKRSTTDFRAARNPIFFPYEASANEDQRARFSRVAEIRRLASSYLWENRAYQMKKTEKHPIEDTWYRLILSKQCLSARRGGRWTLFGWALASVH